MPCGRGMRKICLRCILRSPQAAALAGRSFGTDYFLMAELWRQEILLCLLYWPKRPRRRWAFYLGMGIFSASLEAAAVVIDDYILNVTPPAISRHTCRLQIRSVVTDDEGGALSAQELMEAILSVDPTQVALAPWYPAELIFLEGSLNGKFWRPDC